MFIGAHKLRESRNGNALLILDIEDKSDSCECIKFSPTAEEVNIVKNNPVVGLKLRLSKRDLRTQIQITALYTIAMLNERLYSALHLTLSDDKADMDTQLQELRSVLIDHPGECAVMLHIADQVVRSSVHIGVRFSDQLTKQLHRNAIVRQVIWQ